MRYLWKNKILIVILLLLVIMFPSTISIPQQSRTENIVTAVGIDKTGDEFEVSIQYVIPYAGDGENTFKMSSAKGKTVAEAIETLNVETGRLSGFAHCRALVFNKAASEQNLTELLDYFIRIKTNTNNIVLLCAKESSKDTLAAVKNFNGEFYTILNANGFSNDQRRYQDFKSVGDYYNCFFSPSKSIAISVIDLKEDSSSKSSGETSGGSAGGNDLSGGGGGSESGGGGEKKVANAGEQVIIKDSKFVAFLNKEQATNLAFFNPSIKDMNYLLQHFSDEKCRDVSIYFDIHDKSSKVDVSFANGKPHYTLDLTLNMRATEIVGENVGENLYFLLNKKFTDTLRARLTEEITSKLRQAEEHFRENKYDVVRCYETFYKFKNKEFKEYLSSLPEGKYFMDDVVFDYKITIKQQL